ncbi:MAG: glycosyltransferase, partial [Candidatus Pacebacteria bacterium]|nr:glycosyltransferase [Candidatus Paceibacterota bacterium]
IMGENPTIPESSESKNWDELKSRYITHRLFLNTNVNQYEDGYNLSMLEAMATGMPVVSTANDSSPLIDGENGFISDEIDYLREKIQFLFKNRDEAKRIGQNGRRTVKEKFSLNAFIENWEMAIDDAVRKFVSKTSSDFGEHAGKSDINKTAGKNESKTLLLNYVSNPVTTAAYFERSFRQLCNVITCGPSITEEIIQKWDLGQIKDEVKDHNIICSTDVDITEIFKMAAQSARPDFYLWIDTGISSIPKNLEGLGIPKACYLIDVHIDLKKHLVVAVYFDFVFVAQKEYIQHFKDAGCSRVYWLPLGCDPGIHQKVETEKIYDVGFVGSITSAHVRRKKLLNSLSEKFNVYIERCFLEDMAKVFCRSKIVFNDAINYDLNMRVFEALSIGSCLFTDEAQGSGLTDLFKDKEHLIIYNDDNLLELAEYYVLHNKEREEIARKGRREVLTKHTYEHRAEQMMNIIFKEVREGNFISLDKSSTAEKPEGYFQNVREDIIGMIPSGINKVLDVGCASGNTGKKIKELGVPFVVGIEKNEEAGKEAEKHLDAVHIGDIETISISYPEKCFDCILCADVLEHLVDPAQALKKLKKYLHDDGVIIASIPNVQYYGVMLNLAEGNWTYEKEGILDKTHLRFFTLKEIKKLFEQTGFKISETEVALDPQYKNYSKQKSGQLKFGRVLLQDLTEEELRNFFVYQYKIIAKKVVNKELQDILDKASQMQSKDIEKAIEMYKDAESKFPEDEGPLLKLGACMLATKKIEESEKYYKKAERLSPISSKSVAGLGFVEIQKGNLNVAADYFQKAIARDSSNDIAIYGEGLCLWVSGEKNKAFQKYCEALDINIENMQALTSLTEVAYDLGSFEAVKKYFTEYITLHPANLNMLFSLAGIQFKLGEIKEAKKNLENILIFDPNRTDARQLLKIIEGHFEHGKTG